MSKTRIDWAKYIWQDIPGFPNYYACREGYILSKKNTGPIVLKGITHERGHLYIFLYRDNLRVKKYIHDLILITFIGFPTQNQLCRHLDGNPTHNELSNLHWGTPLENSNDKRIHGTMPYGEKSGTHKLTEYDVLEIRKKHRSMSLRELGKRFGVSHTAIRRAALGIKWGHLHG